MLRRPSLTLAVVLLVGSIVNAQQAIRLNGTILDPSGAVIPAASVKVSRGSNVLTEGLTDARGDFSFDLAPGGYRLEVRALGFRPREQNVEVRPNSGRLSISLTVAAVDAAVDVVAIHDSVSLESDASLNSTTISGDAVKDLPDDEEALLARLRALAAVSGAAGRSATLVVDGLTDGNIPPRDQIQQVIIDTNVFSADSAGGSRIQIITKTGSSMWTGNVNATYNDQSLNARNPFDPDRPQKRQHTFNLTYGGPVIPKKLTIRFNARSLQLDQEGASILAVTPTGRVNQGVFSPTRYRNLNLNGQLSLTKNTFDFGLNYNTNELQNQGVGGFVLPERATNFKGHNWNFNLRERKIVNPKLVSDLRLSVFHNQNSQMPVTEALAINVLDAFNGGGAQNRTRRRSTSYKLGNTIRWGVKRTLNLLIGADFADSKNYSSSETDYLGVFTFSSLDEYLAGHPVTFSKITGDPAINVSQLEFAAFAQADWRVNGKLNVGAGVRYQAQQNLRDYNNVAPTFEVAYQPWAGAVLRAGGRVSYDTYAIGYTEQLVRQSGLTHQVETVILNPSYPDPYSNGASNTVGPGAASIRRQDPRLVAPYAINSAVTLEQNLKKGWRFSTSFDIARGVHIVRTRNVNAPYPGTPLPEALLDNLNSFDPVLQAAARDQVDRLRPLYPSIGNVYQFESAGASFSKNVSIRLYTPNHLATHGVMITSVVQYTLGWAYDDSWAVNQYNWQSEWALSSLDARHRFSNNLSLKFPKATSVSLLTTASSGRPYSLTTGRDNNGDQTVNDRPPGVARNSLIGPGSYTVSASFRKQFALRKPDQSARTPGDARPEPNLEFTVTSNNLLNNTQLRGYSGVLTSPLFGKPTGTAAGRVVTLGLGVNF